MSDQQTNQNPSLDESSSTVLEVKKPKLYKVILHNDHYTSMDFVVEILVEVFHKSASEATQLMMIVHHKGKAVCGIYPFDIAETKVHIVTQKARKNNFPLKCTLEPVEE